MIACRLTVHGYVQGVGYRWSMAREATRCGVQGWVRNRADGSVEAQVEGDRADVEAVVAWARYGPPSARVRDVEVTEGPALGLSGFTIED